MDLVNWLLGRRPQPAAPANADAALRTNFAQEQFHGFSEGEKIGDLNNLRYTDATVRPTSHLRPGERPAPPQPPPPQRHLPPDMANFLLPEDAARMRAEMPEAKDRHNFFFERMGRFWGNQGLL